MNGKLRISPSLREKSSSEQVSMRKQGGFTLIELMAVIGIMAAMMLIANGAYDSIRDSTRSKTAMQELRSILVSARLVALSKGQPVQVTINYTNGAAGVANTISATHMGGTLSGNAVTGNERHYEGVHWNNGLTAGNTCNRGWSLKKYKTIQFKPRGGISDLNAGGPGSGGTPSVVVSTDPFGTKNKYCLQVRPATGRVAVMN